MQQWHACLKKHLYNIWHWTNGCISINIYKSHLINLRIARWKSKRKKKNKKKRKYRRNEINFQIHDFCILSKSISDENNSNMAFYIVDCNKQNLNNMVWLSLLLLHWTGRRSNLPRQETNSGIIFFLRFQINMQPSRSKWRYSRQIFHLCPIKY